MKRSIIVLVAAVGVAWSLAAPAADEKTKELVQGSYRWERNGWIYVHLEGPPERLGYQHGYVLAEEIDDLLRVLKPWLQRTTKTSGASFRAR